MLGIFTTFNAYGGVTKQITKKKNNNADSAIGLSDAAQEGSSMGHR
jgi:hypothetical protein